MRKRFREGYGSTKWTRSNDYVMRTQRHRNLGSLEAGESFGMILVE